MKPSTRRTLLTWVVWLGITGVATALMVQFRGQFDELHAVLIYLLLTLIAGATSSRALGVTLACVSFVLIDVFFQPPFGHLTIAKPIDFVSLAAFLCTAIVSTQLLARAQFEARAARQRSVEVASLARLGSETLSVGRPEDTLGRVAEVIRVTMGMRECVIIPSDKELPDASTPALDGSVGTMAIPLFVEDRPVGHLVLTSGAPVTLDSDKRRFLDAISYYAALAVDRVRLVAEAEHAEALREADKLKDVVLASVSHDLRTPLTTIMALAQSEALRGNKSAAAIEEQAARLHRLVNDLLDLSRLKGGGFAAQLELNTAEDLIGAATRQTRGLLGEQRLHTVIDLESPALVGYFDFSQSLRVLANLLENAARYSPPTEPVELEAARVGNELVFRVSDRGPGISSEDASRVFEPFYRVNGSAPDAGRAGLGLSIARTLAELQGGSLTYASRPGGGSVFTFRVRAAELHANALD